MKARSVAAGMESNDHEVAPSEETRPQLANVPSREKIRRQEYEIHIERCGIHGWDRDDWLQAERELAEELKAS